MGYPRGGYTCVARDLEGHNVCTFYPATQIKPGEEAWVCLTDTALSQTSHHKACVKGFLVWKHKGEAVSPFFKEPAIAYAWLIRFAANDQIRDVRGWELATQD